jgi:hypothetical protein
MMCGLCREVGGYGKYQKVPKVAAKVWLDSATDVIVNRIFGHESFMPTLRYMTRDIVPFPARMTQHARDVPGSLCAIAKQRKGLIIIPATTE